MTEEPEHARVQIDQTFAGTSCLNNNGGSNFDKCGTCIDRIKPFLGLSLESRIYSGLETFVCDSNSRHAKRFPRVKKCLDMVTAWGDYVDAFCSKDANTRTESTTRARVQREISAEQSDLQNTNVWTFINEKDYWLCQDQVTSCGLSVQNNSRIQDNSKGIPNSDLEVEIGSTLEEEVRARSHTLIRSNMSDFTVYNNCNCTKLSKSETRQTNLDLILQLNKKTSNPLQEVPQNVKLQRKKRFSQKTRSTMTNCHEYPRVSRKSSKLRIFSHKSVSTESLTRSNAANAPNISVPCDSGSLMVQIFDVAPSLSDSCLIRTQKFRNSIENACSCLNNVLRTLDDTENKGSSRNYKIESNCVDLSLQYSRVPTIQLFLNRVPNQCVRKSTECQTTVENREMSDIPEKRCLEVSKAHDDRFNQKRGGVVFYSPCSNISLLEEEKVKSRKTVQFHDEVERKVCGNKVSCAGYEREVDFVVSPSFTAPKFQDSVTSEKSVKEAEGSSVPLFAGEREGKGGVEQVNADTRNEIDGRKFSNDSGEEKAEPYDFTNPSDSCSSDSLKVCNAKRRPQKENSTIAVHFERRDLGERTDSSSSFQEDTFEAATPSEARGSNLKPETNVQQGSNTSSRKKDSSRERSPISESKNSGLETKGDTTGYRRIDLREESVPRKDSLRGLEKRRSLEEIEKYSDSIGAPNPNFSDTDSDVKCSRCGKDLCSEEAIERVSTCVRSAKKLSSLEMIATSTLFMTTDVETKVGDGNMPALPPKCKMSRAANRGTPIRSRYVRPIRVDPSQDPSSKCPGSCQRILSNNTRHPERTLAFAATNVRTNRNQRRSKFSTDLGSFSENFCVSSTTPGKSGSPRSRSTLKSKLHSLRFRVPSFKDFRGSRTKGTTSETWCKKQWSHFPDLSRYRKRLWRSSIVPTNFCGSFPANSVSQLKHLLHKKLRRLLLERDRGTSTPKTFLENDRYLISISSGKLIDRIVRGPCCRSRCPFTARNREKAGGQGETVPERKFRKGNLGDGGKERCRRLKGAEILGKIGNEPSRFQERKRVCRWRKNEGEFAGDKVEGKKPSFRCGGGPDGRSSVATFGSTKLIFVAKDARDERTYLYFDRKSCDKSRELREEKLNRGKCHRKNIEKVKSSRNRKGQFREAVFEDRGRTFCLYNLGSFEKHSLDIGEDEGNDLVKLFNVYEKRINNLNVDFRLKLSQYVALCRSVKDCLVTRLRSDDACEVSSSSV